MKLLIIPAILAALALPSVVSADGACRPVFVAGEGVIDSCTGKHRSPYPDPPPQPTIIYVDITFAPNISVHVNNVVTSTSISTSSASANAGASSSSRSTNPTYIVKPRVKKP